tara:strand:+ start:238 stop:912 length:675 start_codon:yes stop_codon:yes gene_type:complete
MAGAGYKQWATGAVLTSSDMNTYVGDQVVMVFASSSARSSAISSPSEGMVSYLSDSNAVEVYTGAGWEGIGDITAVNAGANIDVTNGTGPIPSVALAIDAEVNFADQLATRPEMKDYAETVNAIGSTGGGTQDIDLTAGNVVSATVDTSANTFTFSNPSATGKSCSFTLILTNGGSQTVNWPSAVKWAGGAAPALTTSGVDVLTFFTLDAGTNWYGFTAGLAMA